MAAAGTAAYTVTRPALHQGVVADSAAAGAPTHQPTSDVAVPPDQNILIPDQPAPTPTPAPAGAPPLNPLPTDPGPAVALQIPGLPGATETSTSTPSPTPRPSPLSAPVTHDGTLSSPALCPGGQPGFYSCVYTLRLQGAGSVTISLQWSSTATLCVQLSQQSAEPGAAGGTCARPGATQLSWTSPGLLPGAATVSVYEQGRSRARFHLVVS